MNHVDVFTGIGGFALAAQQVWRDDYKNICFCDNNKFCQEVIKKNFGKESLIYGDIKEVTRERIAADTERMRKLQPEGRKQNKREWACDILTGGFPCQPFSQAGKRKGTEDNRYLWPEMLRVIKDTKPKWIIAENVRGILTIEKGLVFEQVCLDLEREGYAVQSLIIPACAVNAPHRRDRVWIVAHNAPSIRCGKENKTQAGRDGTISSGSDASNSQGLRGRGCPGQERRTEERKIQPEESKGSEIRSESKGCTGDDSDTRTERLEKPGFKLKKQTTSIKNRNKYYNWEIPWLEVATKLCRVDDGLPAELDGFKLTKAGHRVERLKALGNAIVPQVAMEIMRAIKEVDYEKQMDK